MACEVEEMFMRCGQPDSRSLSLKTESPAREMTRMHGRVHWLETVRPQNSCVVRCAWKCSSVLAMKHIWETFEASWHAQRRCPRSRATTTTPLTC